MTTTPLDTARSLWPGSRLTRRPGTGPALLVLPSAGRPRLLVPTGTPGAAVMLRRHSRRRTERIGQDLLGWGVRTGALAMLPVQRLVPGRAGVDVEALVRSLLPTAGRVGALLGPPRANAKPVLQVFDSQGATIAFGKVGHDAAAARLVLGEGQVLSDPRLRELSTVAVPEVLGTTEWAGMPVLLLSAMSGAQRRAGSWELPVAEIREVAESTPLVWCEVIASTYWSGLRERADRLPGGRAHALVERLVPLVSGCRLGFGRWHGDWAPWNSARAGGRLQLWDWEQSTTGVPLGLDAVHFGLQECFLLALSAEQVAESLVGRASLALDAWYPDVEAHRTTVLLYLAEITLRYEHQATSGVTAQLSHRLEVLERVSERLLDRASRAQEGVR